MRIHNLFNKLAPATIFPILFWQKIAGNVLLLPFYHCVSDQAPTHIQPLYTPRSLADFEKDIQFFLEHWQPISIQDLIAHIHENKPIKPSFLISFDDGLREFKTNAVPILKKYNLSACNFLNTDFIDNKGLFFRFKIALLIQHLNKNPHLLQEKTIKKHLDTNNYSSQLLGFGYDKIPLIDQLGLLLKVDFDEYLKTQKPYLHSDEIIELQKQGFHFGAHSMSHPEYRFISLADQIKQTKGSLHPIMNIFQEKFRLFAFPFTDAGIGNSFFDAVEEDLQLSFGTAGIRDDQIKWNLQRTAMEAKGSAEKIIKNELGYYSMLKLIRKNKINRSQWK